MSGVTELDLRFATCLADKKVCELEGNTSC